MMETMRYIILCKPHVCALKKYGPRQVSVLSCLNICGSSAPWVDVHCAMKHLSAVRVNSREFTLVSPVVAWNS